MTIGPRFPGFLAASSIPLYNITHLIPLNKTTKVLLTPSRHLSSCIDLTVGIFPLCSGPHWLLKGLWLKMVTTNDVNQLVATVLIKRNSQTLTSESSNHLNLCNHVNSFLTFPVDKYLWICSRRRIPYNCLCSSILTCYQCIDKVQVGKKSLYPSLCT